MAKYFTKEVDKDIAFRWAMELINQHMVIKAGCWLLGADMHDHLCMGIMRGVYETKWSIMISSEYLEDKNEMYYDMMMDISGRDGWEAEEYSPFTFLVGSEQLRSNPVGCNRAVKYSRYNDHHRKIRTIEDDKILSLVDLGVYDELSEELFKQLPEAIREAVNNELPPPDVLDKSRGRTLEEVARYCISTAVKRASRELEDILWEEFRKTDHSTDPL